MTAAPSRRMPSSLLAIAAIFSVQFGNAFVGSLFAQVGPLGAAALRLGFAALILVVIVRPRVRAWGARTWLGVALLGIGMAGMNVFIYLSIDEIPLGLAVTIELMGPLAVAAAGIRRPVDAAWVGLAVGGILLLGLDDTGAVTLRGALFAAVAAAFWALYILASARLSSRVRGIDGLVAAVAVAALVVVPFGAVDAAVAVRQDPALLGAFAILALMTSVVAYGLEFLALKRMTARVFGVLSSLGPAVAALAGFAVLHQQLDARQLLAILLVVCASAGVVATSRRTA
ncbi:transporter [Leucobacter sp. UCD-THU]|uniref:EamA family transporter n=1 Tax=Leucobacter sp. UCD-THU TaxID=1292023 RepID=UPI000372C1D2|nr:EamA family transporter [Leucobacter sp. UCD-THU]EYT52005.1 transporter [Leucobacter sp. UCD-THU]